jgi:hypothetical protein
MSTFSETRGGLPFLVLSIVFWAFVVCTSLFWHDVYRQMGEIITMHSEYTLLEQGTKALLLVMMFGSLIAFNREGDDGRGLLAIVFLLFALALYFAESNFINEVLQPLVGAVFILVSFRLLAINDKLALAALLSGCVVIVLGMVSDVLLDHPDMLPSWDVFRTWQAVAAIVEEYFDFWGVAFVSYASLIAFRAPVTQALQESVKEFAVLLAGIALITAGNSFAHWQYKPSPTFELIATAMAVLGVLGILRFGFGKDRREPAFVRFSKSEFSVILVAIFVVLPIIYGGTGTPINFIFIAAFLYTAYRYLQIKRAGMRPAGRAFAQEHDSTLSNAESCS